MGNHLIAGNPVNETNPLSAEIVAANRQAIADAVAAAVAAALAGLAVTGHLTDAELRDSAVPVSISQTAGANGVTAANSLVAVPATIATGESLSAEIDLGAGRVLCGIDMPADWTAANLTFQASYNSGGTFDNLYDQYGTEKTVTAAEDRYIPLDDPAFWMGVRYLKVRSGTAASAVAQGAERVIQLIVKPV